MASILKGLNAYHANPNAASSAGPNSQVGRIAAYVSSSENTNATYDEWTRAYNEYLAFKGSYDGPLRDEIQDQLDNLQDESDTYDVDLITLEEQQSAFEAHEAETARLMQISNDFGNTYESAGQVENDALETAAGGRTLSAEEEQQFRELLGL
ncbi:MAG: hypothetical protein P8Q50_07415 [Octadecabacter sp.]|nr:hypothetical protein [Octadecabacter sp.]